MYPYLVYLGTIIYMSTRLCTKCGIVKDLETGFVKDKYDPTGYTYRCKSCRAAQQKIWVAANPASVKRINDKNKLKRKSFYDSLEGIESSRRAHLKRMYNITLEEYNEMLEKQDHKCMICGKTEMNYKNKVLCVDHNHDTGQIRGLLCGLCNSGIGKFREDPQLLENTIKYLKYYESIAPSRCL